MQCVGYDWEFEKDLARSFERIDRSRPSGSVKKRKVVQDNDSLNDDGENEEGKDSESESSHSRCPRMKKRA